MILCLSANCPSRFALSPGRPDLAGDGPRAERLGELEGIVQHVVAEVEDVVVLHDLDEHAGVFVLLAELLGFAHRSRGAPFLEFVGGRLPGGGLFRRRRAALPAAEAGGGHAHEKLDRLGAKFHGTDIQLRRIRRGPRRRSSGCSRNIRNVQANLHAGHLRIRPGSKSAKRPASQAGGRQRRQRELTQFTSRIQHRVSLNAVTLTRDSGLADSGLEGLLATSTDSGSRSSRLTTTRDSEGDSGSRLGTRRLGTGLACETPKPGLQLGTRRVARST